MSVCVCLGKGLTRKVLLWVKLSLLRRGLRSTKRGPATEKQRGRGEGGGVANTNCSPTSPPQSKGKTYGKLHARRSEKDIHICARAQAAGMQAQALRVFYSPRLGGGRGAVGGGEDEGSAGLGQED